MEKKIIIAVAVILGIGLIYAGVLYFKPRHETVMARESYKGLAIVKSTERFEPLRGSSYQVITLQPENSDEEFRLVIPYASDRFENDIIFHELFVIKRDKTGRTDGTDIVYVEIEEYGEKLNRFEFVTTVD